MWKKIGIAVVALLALFVVVVALQPAEFRVERRATIEAPAPVVFSMIDDLHVWDTWSPWSKLDPSMTKTFGGPERGKGATYEWSGNKEVGRGRMEITDARENEEVAIDLHFIEPFEAQNKTVFTIAPKGNGVEVVWSMTGKNNFVSKAFCLFMDMDKMVGGDFEKGLAELKRLAEEKARTS